MMRFCSSSGIKNLLLVFLCVLVVLETKGSIWSSLAGVDNENMKLIEKVEGGTKRFRNAPGHVGLALLGHDSKPFFRVVVSKGSSLPASNSITLTTSRDDQTFIDVSIYYGTYSNPHLNTKMDTCRIEVPSGKKGEVRVRIDILVDETGTIQLLSDRDSTCMDTHDLKDLVEKNMMNEKERLEKLIMKLELREAKLVMMEDSKDDLDDVRNRLRIAKMALRDTKIMSFGEAEDDVEDSVGKQIENAMERSNLYTQDLENELEIRAEQLRRMRDVMRSERSRMEAAMRKAAESEEHIALAAEKLRVQVKLVKVTQNALQNTRDELIKTNAALADAKELDRETQKRYETQIEAVRLELSETRTICEEHTKKHEARVSELLQRVEVCESAKACESVNQDEDEIEAQAEQLRKMRDTMRTERIKMNEAIRRYEESEEQIALASEKLKVETMARESCLRKKEECENELSQLQMTCATTKEKNSRCHDTLVHLQEECSKCDDTVSLKKTLMEIKQEKEKCENTITRLMEERKKKNSGDEGDEIEQRCSLLRRMRDTLRTERDKMDEAIRRSNLGEEHIALAAEKLQVERRIVQDMREALQRARDEVTKTQEDALVLDCQSEIETIRHELEASSSQDLNQVTNTLREVEEKASSLLERVSMCEMQKQSCEDSAIECDAKLKTAEEKFTSCESSSSSCFESLKDLRSKHAEVETRRNELKKELRNTKDSLTNELLTTRTSLRERTNELDVIRRRLKSVSENKECHNPDNDDDESLVFLATMALILVGTILAIVAAARAHMASKRIEMIEREHTAARHQQSSGSTDSSRDDVKRIKIKFQKERDEFKEKLRIKNVHLSSSDEKINSLQKDLKVARERKNDARTELESVRKSNEANQKRISELESKLRDQNRHLQKMDGCESDLKRTKMELESKLRDQNSRIKELEGNESEMRQTLNREKQKYMALIEVEKEQLKKLEEEMHAQLNSSSKDLLQARKSVSNLEIRLEQAHSEAREHRRKSLILEDSLDTVKREQKESDCTKSELDKLRNENEDLRVKLESAESEQKLRTRASSSDMRMLESQIQDLNDQKDRQSKRHEERVRELAREVREKSEECDTWRQRHAESSKLRDRSDDKVSEVESDLRVERDRVSRLKDEIESLRVDSQRASDDVRSENASLKAKIRDSSDRVSRLEQELERSKEIASRMEKMNEKEISYLKDQHEVALKDLNRRLEESLSKRDEEKDVEVLRLELEEQRNVLESALSKKMELENKLERKTRELDSKENALNESSKRVSEMQYMLNESSKKSEVETESLREAFLEEQQKRAQQAEQLESLQKKWHEAENELHRLSSELEVATKKEQSAVESSSILQDTLESVRDELNSHRDRLEAAQTRNDALRLALDKATDLESRRAAELLKQKSLVHDLESKSEQIQETLRRESKRFETVSSALKTTRKKLLVTKRSEEELRAELEKKERRLLRTVMSSSSPSSSAPSSRPKSGRELSPSPIEFEESVVEKSNPSESGTSTRRTLRDAFEKMKSPAKTSTTLKKKNKLVGEAFRIKSSPRTRERELRVTLNRRMSSATLADGSRNAVHTLVRRYSSRQNDVARLSARSLSLSEEALLWTVFHHYTIRGAGEVSNTMHMSTQQFRSFCKDAFSGDQESYRVPAQAKVDLIFIKCCGLHDQLKRGGSHFVTRSGNRRRRLEFDEFFEALLELIRETRVRPGQAHRRKGNERISNSTSSLLPVSKIEILEFVVEVILPLASRLGRRLQKSESERRRGSAAFEKEQAEYQMERVRDFMSTQVDPILRHIFDGYSRGRTGWDFAAVHDFANDFGLTRGNHAICSVRDLESIFSMVNLRSEVHDNVVDQLNYEEWLAFFGHLGLRYGTPSLPPEGRIVQFLRWLAKHSKGGLSSVLQTQTERLIKRQRTLGNTLSSRKARLEQIITGSSSKRSSSKKSPSWKRKKNVDSVRKRIKSLWNKE